MKPKASFLVVALTLSIVGVGSWTENRALAQGGTCAGDCNHDDRVSVDELVTGVHMALGTMPVDRCPDLDPGGDNQVTVDEIVAAVENAIDGCGAHANHPPQASDVSFGADTATAYLEQQLIGTDPDNDTITYELLADISGPGYNFAYVNPESGKLYLTLVPDFEGTIVLPYHVTDGRLFSDTATATIDVHENTEPRNTGLKDVDPKEYATYPRGFYDGTRLGAPGAAPALPTWVDLSKDFPLPASQGNQNSCVGWAIGYAIKSYQERVELGWSLEPPEHRFSPAYIYNQINEGVDKGAVYAEGLDLVVNQGVASLALMPYDDTDFLTQPSFAARQEAAQFKALDWKVANDVLTIKNALANHLAVFFGIQVFSNLPRLRGPDSVYNSFEGTWEGGHAIAVVGYDDNRYGGAFRIINSWGQNFGDGGYFWIPYDTAVQTVNTPNGPKGVVTFAAVLDDAADPNNPPADPVDPPPAGDLPDLQVTNWTTNFNGTPGGSGSLQYTVTNTGIATAPAGAYVALSVSRDPTFASGNSLVVYERIPFDIAPGTTVYRDQNNAISFNFPYDLEPGQYYMAFKADMFNDVAESNEGNNISYGTTPINIVNTLPDMQVQSWYASWDELGNGSLTYNVINNGASTALASSGWLITLALSPNNIIGDGDEIFIFSEPANFDIGPGGTLYRDGASAASFLLSFDYFGNPVPDGYYYISLWLDPNGFLAESNEFNNASMSWGTIGIGVAGLSADTTARASAENSSMAPGEAYNGKVLPAGDASTRMVRISTTPQGRRRMEFLGDGADADSGPRVKEADSPRWSKTAHARQQVIFPVTEAKPMPSAD